MKDATVTPWLFVYVKSNDILPDNRFQSCWSKIPCETKRLLLDPREKTSLHKLKDYGIL